MVSVVLSLFGAATHRYSSTTSSLVVHNCWCRNGKEQVVLVLRNLAQQTRFLLFVQVPRVFGAYSYLPSEPSGSRSYERGMHVSMIGRTSLFNVFYWQDAGIVFLIDRHYVSIGVVGAVDENPGEG